MKVCIFANDIDKSHGGPSRSVPILSKGLDSNGCDVTLMTLRTNDMNIHALDGTNVKLKILPQYVSSTQLEDAIISENYDIIHLQSVWTYIYHKVAKIARKNKIPYLMTPRGMLEPWCYTNDIIVRRIKKHIAMICYQKHDLQEASCILTTADMEMNHVRDLGIVAPIAVIPNGLDFADYPCRIESKNIKKQVLFLSRLEEKKGIDYLIRSWVKVSSIHPDWKVKIVGNGNTEYIEKLRRLIDNLKVSKWVEILPPAYGKDKYKLYSESSLFVLPSHSENFGMVIAEALSCGVPVVTTKDTPWEILNETRTGWWIELCQQNLDDAIISAIDLGQDELYKMGQKGAMMVRKNFWYSEVGKKLKNVYEWILKKSNKPEYVYER